MAGPQLVGAQIVVHHRVPRHAQQGEQQRRGEAGAVLAGGAMEHQRPVRAIAQGGEQGTEARRAAARIVAIVIGQEAHHDEGRGAAVGNGPPDLLADPGLDMGADDPAGQAFDGVGRFGRLVDAAQVDDGANADPCQRCAVIARQVAEMGRAEDRTGPDGAAVSRAIAAEVAKIGAALERHDEGKALGLGGDLGGHAAMSITSAPVVSCRIDVRIFAPGSPGTSDACRTGVHRRRRRHPYATGRKRPSRSSRRDEPASPC